MSKTMFWVPKNLRMSQLEASHLAAGAGQLDGLGVPARRLAGMADRCTTDTFKSDLFTLSPKSQPTTRTHLERPDRDPALVPVHGRHAATNACEARAVRGGRGILDTAACVAVSEDVAAAKDGESAKHGRQSRSKV